MQYQFTLISGQYVILNCWLSGSRYGTLVRFDGKLNNDPKIDTASARGAWKSDRFTGLITVDFK